MANKTTQDANDKAVKYHISRMEVLGLKPTPKNLTSYLIEYAKSGQITKASWHKLRFQFLEQQKRSGFDKAVDALAWDNLKTKLEGVEWKSKRVGVRKPLAVDTSKRYLEALGRRYPDGIGWAYWTICEKTGCRPSEVASMLHSSDGFCSIRGSKRKAGRGGSGLDRDLRVKGAENVAALEKAFSLIEAAKSKYQPVEKMMAKAQQEVAAVARLDDLPHRSLKSLRHQKATEMKTAGWSPVQIASVLGHQATKTQQHYGRRHSRSAVDPSIEVIGAHVPKSMSAGIRDNLKVPNEFFKRKFEKRTVGEVDTTSFENAVADRFSRPSASQVSTVKSSRGVGR